MEKVSTSGEQLLADVLTYSNAGSGIIHVRAKEVARAYKELRDGITTKGFECNTWNIVTGKYIMTSDDLDTIALRGGDSNPDFQGNLINLFSSLEDTDATSHVYHIYVNADRWFEEPAVEYLIQQMARDLPSTCHRIIFITADNPLPDNVSDLMVSATMATPTYNEFLESYTSLLDTLPDSYTERLDIDDEGIASICRAGSGLTWEEFETYLSEAFVRSMPEIVDRDIVSEDILSYLNKSKTYIVNKSDLLELYPPESIDSVGGLENVKDWVERRKGCYSEEARALGIEPPKGILLTGVPGSGKSLLAKSIAGVLGAGLVKLDMGKIFNSFVGKSEERIRKALALAEDLSPVVLFLDEIEKGLGGTSSGGDAGTSKRVLGTFLSWMQDCTKPVFVVASANDVTQLPPELTRKGRLDQIFFMGLPNEKDKKEIFNIHLAKRGYGEVFTDNDINSMMVHFNGFVGAEIEAVVKEALINMFSDGLDELDAQHIAEAAKTIIPLSKSHASVVAEIIAWGSQNAVSASIGEVEAVKAAKKRRTRNVSSIH